MAPRGGASGPLVAALIVGLAATSALAQGQRWTEERANEWYAGQPWLVGCNYAPASVVNQLEMWQPETFNTTEIAAELSLAQSIGFNSLRVFLHDQLWRDDAAGLLERFDVFLNLAAARRIGIMLVLFDGVWDPKPVSGPQADPIPFTHNSRWVQGPGRDILGNTARHAEMRDYVVGIVSHIRDDPRVQVIDVMNEPDNPNPVYALDEIRNKADRALELMQVAYAWIRELAPIQPVTSGVWAGDWSSNGRLSPLQLFQLEQSDIITFHNYGSPSDMEQRINNLRRYNRPILCTEYMARSAGSTFDGVMPILRREKVGAYNWGFVYGRTQTIFPWDSWARRYTGEPDPWFHDIFRGDYSPYRVDEVELIRNLTGAAPPTHA